MSNSHAHSHGHGVPPGGIHDLPKVHAAGASDTAGHHGHHINSATTLMLVLLTLLFFTLLTVAASMAEQFLAQTFEMHIPAWVNVIVALSIATVKTTLVVMFFMGLKYDNPINSMIFLFTLGGVACFLGFTMLDLGNRQTIDRFKGHYIIPGGMGGVGDVPANQSITEYAAQKALLAKEQSAADSMLGLDAGAHEPAAPASHADDHAADHGGHGPQKPARSSPQHTRPVKGITLPGLSAGGH
ncbi:MAG: cytochrome C oxidase subunit IV family protein [Phycisphaerales bacterium]